MKKFSKALAVAIVLSTVAAPSTFAAEASTTSTSSVFSDLGNASFWAKDSIVKAQELGLVTGFETGEFQPLSTVSREQIAAILTRVLKLEVPAAAQSSFSDVPAAWSKDYIEAVKNAGIMVGDENGKFRPTELISREELAAVLVRAAKGETAGKGANLAVADKNLVSDWAKDYVQTAIELGLLKGDGTNFNPKSNALRQEIAVTAVRLAEAVTAPVAESVLNGATLTVWDQNDDEDFTQGGTTYPAGSILQYNVNFKQGITLGDFSSAAVDFYVGNDKVGTYTVKEAALATSADATGLSGLIAGGVAAEDNTSDAFWNAGAYSSAQKPTKAVFRLVKDGKEFTETATFTPATVQIRDLLTGPTLAVWDGNDDEEFTQGATTYPAGSILQFNVNFKQGVSLGDFSSAEVDFYVGDEKVGTSSVKAAALAQYAAATGLGGLVAGGESAADTTSDAFWNYTAYTSSEKPSKAVFRFVKDGVEYTTSATVTAVPAQ